jgi:RNA polymerase sigma factor (sigma-70 family)
LSPTLVRELFRNTRKVFQVADTAGLTDGQLLTAFVERRDDAAFAALVRRHGPMVMGVCRRALRNRHDAEDAFQAAFLVLVRKAGSVVPREMVGNWLYGVAHNTALQARVAAAKRKRKEKQVADKPGPEAARPAVWDDVTECLDQELSRLPDKYRVPVVLCDLEGKSHKEAARQLGWPQGTLSGRLARARRLLARRLARHGVVAPVGALAGMLTRMASADVPPAVAVATVRAAAGYAAGETAGLTSAEIAALTEGVLKTMLLNKLKFTTALLLAAAVATAGACLLACRASAGLAPGAASPGTPRQAAAPARSAAQPAPFGNAVGWSWYEAPHRRSEYGASGSRAEITGRGISYILDEDRDGALLVYLAFATNAAAESYRPVAFDAGRKRYTLEPDCGGGHHNVRLARFRLDPKQLPAARAEYLGIEILTPEGKMVRARDALDRARKAGTEVLPFAHVGKPYAFTLTTMDGKRIRGADLRGKVVVIDCWASWCAPCLALVPELKALYEGRRKDGLEIVGICFDRDADRAKAAVKSKGQTWPQVLVPADEPTRLLWEEAAGIDGVPRLLILDRAGVLRADCGPGDLKRWVEKLLDENP